MRRLLATLLVTSALVGARPARADEATEARHLFELGRQAFEMGKFSDAILAFEESYRLAPRASVAFAAGQAYRRQFWLETTRDLGKLRRAIELYRVYLRDQPDGDRRGEAARHVSDLEAARATLEPATGSDAPSAPAGKERTVLYVSGTTGARGSLDASPPESLPFAREVAPGTHEVVVEADGYISERRQETLLAGQQRTVEVMLRERPARLLIEAPEGSEVALGRFPVGVAPLEAFDVRSGRHELSVRQRGHYLVRRTVVVARGQTATVKVDLERTQQRVAAYIVLGTAAASAIAAGITGGTAWYHHVRARDIQDQQDAGGPISESEALAKNRHLEARDDYRTASLVLVATTAGLAATGTLLYLLDKPGLDVDRGRETIVPMVAPGVVGASAAISF